MLNPVFCSIAPQTPLSADVMAYIISNCTKIAPKSAIFNNYFDIRYISY